MHGAGGSAGSCSLLARISPERSVATTVYQWATGVPVRLLQPALRQPGGSWGSCCPWAHCFAVSSIDRAPLYATQMVSFSLCNNA